MIGRLFGTFICIILVSTSARSDDTRLRVLSGGSFAPILEKNELGEPMGLAIDVLERTSLKLKTKYKIKFYPWKRALLSVKNSTVDGIIAAYKTPIREQFLTFVDKPLFIDRMIIVGHEEIQKKWSGNWQALKGGSFL